MNSFRFFVLFIFPPAAGSQLESDTCPRGNEDYDKSSAAFLTIHLTPKSTGYFEVIQFLRPSSWQSAHRYFQATWVWLADHNLDLDGTTQISVFAGRGILSESQGPVWLIGTCGSSLVLAVHIG